MTKLRSKSKRVLAVAPSTRGFGFAVAELDGKLADWGAVGVSSDKNAASEQKVRELIDLYRPDTLVMEDFTSNRCRPERIRELAASLRALAKSKKVAFKAIGVANVRRAICPEGRATKQTVAERLAEMFPAELGYIVPRKRRTSTREDHRMTVFDAVAMAISNN